MFVRDPNRGPDDPLADIIVFAAITGSALILGVGIGGLIVQIIKHLS